LSPLNTRYTCIFTEQRSYASAVLGVLILSVRPSVCLSHTCFFIPQERAILLLKYDFSYSCAAADTISTDL